MATLTTLQLANAITGISIYSKPSSFNGATNSISAFGEQIYVKIGVDATSYTPQFQTVVGQTGTTLLNDKYYLEKTISLSLEDNQYMDNVSINDITSYASEIIGYTRSTITCRLYSNTPNTFVRASISYKLYTTNTTYDPISLIDISSIATSESLTLPLLSGGGLTSVAVNSTTSYFSEFGNKLITVVLSYYNTSTSSNETSSFSFYQELLNDSSDIITSIEITDSPRIDIKDSLYNVFDILSLTFNYEDETSEIVNALEYFTDSSWYDSGTNLGVHLSCANGFYLNGTEYTESDIAVSDYPNVLFKENGDNEITISFYYYDSIQGIYRSFSITFIVVVSGITNVSISPNASFDGEYAPNKIYAHGILISSLTLTTNIISYSIFKNDGTNAELSDLYSYTLTAIDNETLTSYVVDNILPTGEYTITLTYKIRSDYVNQTATCILKVYDVLNSTMSIDFNKSSIIINQNISYSDFKSYLIYPIGTTEDTYTRLVNGVFISPKTATSIGNHDIAFSYNSTLTGYNTISTTKSVLFVSQPYDYIYYFDKIPTLIGGNLRYLRHEYGEIQTNFNMGLVMDGTKDSCQVVVQNDIREELKPNTIIYQESTDTWWIVKQDTSKRYASENGSLWKHTIKLFGLLEIFNARDLIVCGFNKNRYTISEVLNRLISLSDIEYSVVFDLYPYVNGDQKMTYLKTFDNYTPASALKELFNGMNCELKATFTTQTETISGITYISLDELHIAPISKSGTTDDPISIDVFNNEQEEIKSDRENYGTRVVSNVQNCVSAEPIRFPVVGGIRLTSNSERVSTDTVDTAVLRLPSNANKVNKLFGYQQAGIWITFSGGGQNGMVSVSDLYTCDLDYNTLKRIIEDNVNDSGIYEYVKQPLISSINSNLYYFWNSVIVPSKMGEFVLENGGEYYPLDDTTNDKCVIFYATSTPTHGSYPYLALNDRLHFNSNSKHTYSTIYWEQGSNQIKNFRFLTSLFLYPKAMEQYSNHADEPKTRIEMGTGTFEFTDIFGTHTATYNVYFFIINGLRIGTTKYAVEYVPMSDIKMKVDNDKNENDTNLYNQNGKLIDSGAVSKLINSYSQSISSNEITRNKTYFSFFEIPKVGQIVLDNDIEYIINNVSIDFVENDNNHYKMDCEFTMTKKVACKSTMISANTNIRDYDCPQKNNVVRKQTYRDYIEFNQDNSEQVNETPYLDIGSNFIYDGDTKGNIDNHTCIFKVNMNKYGTFYYKVQCVKYNLKKQYYEVCDFMDNNIIGYEANKPYYILSPTNLFKYYDSVVNTPISYVDDYGEFISIELRFLDKNQLFGAYKTLSSDGVYASSYLNTYVSVPLSIWTYINADSTRYDMAIDELNYDKDGLEVPFFEYACQVCDTNNVVCGEDLLNGETPTDGYTFIYGYAITDIAKITEDNAEMFMPADLSSSNASIAYDSETHKLTITLTGNTTNLLNKNVEIFMFERKNSLDIAKKELLFAINGCNVNGTDTIELYVSNYKLK